MSYFSFAVKTIFALALYELSIGFTDAQTLFRGSDQISDEWPSPSVFLMDGTWTQLNRIQRRSSIGWDMVTKGFNRIRNQTNGYPITIKTTGVLSSGTVYLMTDNHDRNNIEHCVYKDSSRISEKYDLKSSELEPLLNLRLSLSNIMFKKTNTLHKLLTIATQNLTQEQKPDLRRQRFGYYDGDVSYPGEKYDEYREKIIATQGCSEKLNVYHTTITTLYHTMVDSAKNTIKMIDTLMRWIERIDGFISDMERKINNT